MSWTCDHIVFNIILYLLLINTTIFWFLANANTFKTSWMYVQICSSDDTSLCSHLNWIKINTYILHNNKLTNAITIRCTDMKLTNHLVRPNELVFTYYFDCNFIAPSNKQMFTNYRASIVTKWIDLNNGL